MCEVSGTLPPSILSLSHSCPSLTIPRQNVLNLLQNVPGPAKEKRSNTQRLRRRMCHQNTADTLSKSRHSCEAARQGAEFTSACATQSCTNAPTAVQLLRPPAMLTEAFFCKDSRFKEVAKRQKLRKTECAEGGHVDPLPYRVLSLGWSNKHDLHRGKSKKKVSSSSCVHMSLADVNVTQKSRRFRWLWLEQDFRETHRSARQR